MFPRIFTKDVPFLSSHSPQKSPFLGRSIPSWSSGQANAWLLLARCHLAAKNHDEAQMSCREAHALCEETKNFQQELEVWQQVGGRIQNFTFHEAKTIQKPIYPNHQWRLSSLGKSSISIRAHQRWWFTTSFYLYERWWFFSIVFCMFTLEGNGDLASGYD